MRKISIIAGVAAAVALTLSGCGSSPSTFVTHGTVEVMTEGVGSSLPTDQLGQVTVVNPSWTVLAATSLAFNFAGTGLVNAEFFTFSADVPSGLPEYGIQVAGVPGTVWETPAQMKAGPQVQITQGN